MTPALSSKYMNSPSFLRIVLRCRITTAGITTKMKGIPIKRPLQIWHKLEGKHVGLQANF